MKRKALSLALAFTAVATTLAFTGCGNTASSTDDTTEAVSGSVSESEANGDDAGFTENPIFEDEEIGFINLSAVYFQPVPMSNGNEDISSFDIHLEADISALENDLGYGQGDWVPYLTVDYEVIGSDGTTAASGTFMTMSASDGPHYGANIALPNADTYSLKITIHNPEENGYLVHTDAVTGPGGTFDEYFADGNLEYTFEGWDYTPQEW